jgi:hypothetical protein
MTHFLQRQIRTLGQLMLPLCQPFVSDIAPEDCSLLPDFIKQRLRERCALCLKAQDRIIGKSGSDRTIERKIMAIDLFDFGLCGKCASREDALRCFFRPISTN